MKTINFRFTAIIFLIFVSDGVGLFVGMTSMMEIFCTAFICALCIGGLMEEK